MTETCSDKASAEYLPNPGVSDPQPDDVASPPPPPDVASLQLLDVASPPKDVGGPQPLTDEVRPQPPTDEVCPSTSDVVVLNYKQPEATQVSFQS